MLEKICKYAKTHQGSLFQAGVGVAELGIAYLLVPDSNEGIKNSLRQSASLACFYIGFMDVAFGWLRSSSDWPQHTGLPNSKEYVFAVQLPVEMAKFSYKILSTKKTV